VEQIVALEERPVRDLNDLSFFAAVVSNGGISAASRALGLPKSRISRRVTALEDQLGVRLLERSTRRFKITEAGEDVYRHARAALSEAEAIDEAVSRLKAEPQGLVRVSCPLGIDRLLAGALQDFLAEYPKIRLQFIVTNRRVDVIEDGIDIAIRIRERLDSDADLQVKIVGRTHAILVASPAFVAAKGQPSAPPQLTGYPTLGLTDRATPDRWRLSNGAGQEVEVAHEPRLSSSSFTILRQAAIGGLGIALLPERVCRGLVESGELVHILPEWRLWEGTLHLVFTSRRGLLPGVRVTIDFLHQVLRPSSPVWESEDAIRL
jgi:DNA-binding transcriptional LysR family regulator